MEISNKLKVDKDTKTSDSAFNKILKLREMMNQDNRNNDDDFDEDNL